MKSHFDFISGLPEDADGDLPPNGTPNYLFHFQDDAWADATLDEIRILKKEVAWNDIPSSYN
jgi:hypothetical protein